MNVWQLLFLALGCAAPPTTQPARPQLAAASADGARVVTVSGDQWNLAVRGISDGQVRCDGENFPITDLMLIETGRPVSTVDTSLQVFLATGGNLPASAVHFTGEKFRVTTTWGVAELAPDNVAGVLLKRDADRGRFDLAMQNRSVENDRVIVESRQGQQAVSGIIEAIDDARLTLNYEGSSRTILLSKIVAIVTADLKPGMPGGPRCTVRLRDGGVLSGVVQALAKDTLSLELPAGTMLPLPWNAVSAMSIASSSYAWLSDLEPAATEYTPLATLPFKARFDASADGNPLTMIWNSNGMRKSFSRGIGTRSASRIEFSNSEGFTRLVATVGIDCETGGAGDCDVSVWGDDIPLWSARISGAGDPVPVDVSIEGMERIALVVRYGKRLDLGDHVDWAEARFIKPAR